MTRKTRLTLLILCVVLFVAFAPYIVLYSLGYRIDFKKEKIVATGGIYVRTFPAADQITIDSKISDKPGMFSNSIFVQSLMPKTHTVLVQKAGYFDYYKTLPVQENEVTKIENVLLFKKDISFATVTDATTSPFLLATQQEKYYIKNNNLYAQQAPSATPAPTPKILPVIKNVLAFQSLNSGVLWLGTDGFLYRSDSAGKNPEKLSITALLINKKDTYKIIPAGETIFLNANGQFLVFNSKTKNFETFAKAITDAKISPDGKNMIYFSGKDLYIYPLVVSEEKPKKEMLLHQAQNNISDAFWINNDYVIFAAGNQVLISEIDYRGNTNTVTLPATGLPNPKIYFSQQEGKLYILSGTALLSSEKITP